MTGKKTEKKTKKGVSKQVSSVSKKRIKQVGKYQSFKLSKKISSPTVQPVPSAYRLFRDSLRFFMQNWKLFSVLLILYAVLQIVFVYGATGSLGLTEIRDSLLETFNGDGGKVATSLSLFGYLLSTGTAAPDQTSALYQSSLLIGVSLVLIWTIRKRLAGIEVTVRDCIYRSTSQLIPFLLVLFVMAIQCVPLIIGSFLFSTVRASQFQLSAFEVFASGSVLFAFSLLSFYMLSSSVFALYIVTLPGTLPMQALRTARKLVMHRRWLVARRVLMLPLFFVTIAAAVFLPLLLWVPGLAEGVYFAAVVFATYITHYYFYNLYRSLL